MNMFTDFLTGTKILEEIESPVNGKIQVVKNLAFGTYVQVGGLTQSGSVVYDIWKTVLKKIKNQKLEIEKCLILGLGAGSSATLVRKFWSNTEITGVDLDPMMVDIGRKYFKFDEPGVKVVIGDVYKLLTKNNELRTMNYNLILIDLYVGDTFPEKFELENYIRRVRRILAKDGLAVFNRLYYGEKRPLAMKFLKKLEKVFAKVDVVYPKANVMFICSS